MKISIIPKPSASGGVSTCIKDLQKVVKLLGHSLVSEEDADIIIGHAGYRGKTRTDICWTHGLYPTGNGGWGNDFVSMNKQILGTIALSQTTVAVSNWGSKIIEKFSGVTPHVIHNGIFYKEIVRKAKEDGCVFWGKTSVNPTCDPKPFQFLHSEFGATFDFHSLCDLPGIKYTSAVKNIHAILDKTSILIATTKENDSFLVMEAMAHGIPILGYNHGMLKDRLVHKNGCFLVEPGDLFGLTFGLHWLKENWNEQSDLAYNFAEQFDWAYQYENIQEVLTLTHDRRCRLPSVSIVIPNYNYGRYLVDAINSAKAQTIPCEIIVVDDYSTDNSREIILEQENIEHIFLAKNSGVSTARNMGIQKATGTHIICLDADDTISPEFAETLLAKFKDGVAITFSPIVFSSGIHKGMVWFTANASLDKQMLGANTVPSCCMFSKDWWQRCDGYDISLFGTEDANLWLKMMLRGGSAIKAVETPLMQYRSHAGQISETHRPKWAIYHTRQVTEPTYSIILETLDNHLIWTYLDKYPFAAFHILDDSDGKYSEPILPEYVFDGTEFAVSKERSWKQQFSYPLE